MANIRITSAKVFRGLAAASIAASLSAAVVASSISVSSIEVVETPAPRVSVQVSAPYLVATPAYAQRLAIGISILPLQALPGEQVRVFDTPVFDATKVFIDILVPSDDVVIVVDHVEEDAVSAVDAIDAFDTDKQVVDSATIVDFSAKTLSRPDVADAVGTQDTDTKLVEPAYADAVGLTDEINAFDATKVLQDEVAILEAISAFNVDQALDSTNATDSIQEMTVSKPLEDAAIAGDQAALHPQAVQTDAAVVVDQINAFDIARVSTDTVDLADTDAKTLERPDVADTAVMADTDAKEVTRPDLVDSVVAEDVDAKDVLPAYADSIGSTDAINAFDIARVSTDTVDLADTDAKTLERPDVADTASVVDADAKDVLPAYADSIGSTDAIDSFNIQQVSTDSVASTDAIDNFVVSQVLTDQADVTEATAKSVIRPDVVDAATAADADAKNIQIVADPGTDGGGFGFYTTPSYVAAGTRASGIGTVSVPPPSGIANGDLLLLFVETANEVVSAPSGWTEISASPQGQGTAATAGATRVSAFYKITTGTESNVSLPDAGDHQSALIFAYRNSNTSSPINVSAGQTQATTTSVQFAGVTTSVDNTRIVHALSFARTLSAAEFIRPDGDVTSTSYTGGFGDIDEATPDDANLAFGAVNSSAPVLEVSLSDPAVTPSGTTGTVRWRSARRNQSGSLTAGNSFTATCTLLQGSTTIASDAYSASNLTTRDFTFNLSDVSDFTDLRLRFNQTASGGNNNTQRSGLAVTWAEIEFPKSTASGSISGWANSNLGTITERHDAVSTDGLGGGLAVADAELLSSGATGTTTATNSESLPNASLTIALQGIFTPPAGSGNTAVVAEDAITSFSSSKVLADATTASDNIVATLTTGSLGGQVNAAMVNQVVVNGGS